EHPERIGFELAELHLIKIVVLRQECALQCAQSLAPVIVDCLSERRLGGSHPYSPQGLVVVFLEFATCVQMLLWCGHSSFLVKRDRRGLRDDGAGGILWLR